MLETKWKSRTDAIIDALKAALELHREWLDGSTGLQAVRFTLRFNERTGQPRNVHFAPECESPVDSTQQFAVRDKL